MVKIPLILSFCSLKLHNKSIRFPRLLLIIKQTVIKIYYVFIIVEKCRKFIIFFIKIYFREIQGCDTLILKQKLTFI